MHKKIDVPLKVGETMYILGPRVSGKTTLILQYCEDFKNTIDYNTLNEMDQHAVLNKCFDNPTMLIVDDFKNDRPSQQMLQNVLMTGKHRNLGCLVAGTQPLNSTLRSNVDHYVTLRA